MIVNYISWAKVEVTYDKPIQPEREGGKRIKSDTYKDVYVSLEPNFHNSKSTMLHIRDVMTGDGMANRSLLLGRAKLKKLTPWKAEFEAYYFGNDITTRCNVVCTFEDRK